jgi:hypothetical protein
VEVIVEPPILVPPGIDVPVVNTPVIEAEATGPQVEIVLLTGYRISVSGAYVPEALCGD